MIKFITAAEAREKSDCIPETLITDINKSIKAAASIGWQFTTFNRNFPDKIKIELKNVGYTIEEDYKDNRPTTIIRW